MQNNLLVGRRLRPLLFASLLAIAIIAYTTALPTNWFRSTEVTGTILPPPVHTWIVDDDGPADFNTIQEAIDSPLVVDGDKVFVYSGTYYERVLVDKTVSLIGEDRDTTIIDGMEAWPPNLGVLTVLADGVTIRGFTIRRSGTFTSGLSGIFLTSESSGNTITENVIIENLWGVHLISSSNNVVYGNVIANNYDGIHFFDGSNNNAITENEIISNNWYGIRLDSHCDNNVIYHNNFLNNAIKQVTTWFSANVWDDGYPSGGNYWSDYGGVDFYSGPFQNVAGGDGVGDTPYFVDADNRDNYPLKSPHEYWSNPIPGDINRDTRVNYDDMFSLAVAYGSTPDKPNWNPSADVNHDGRINYKDLYKLAINYGKTYS